MLQRPLNLKTNLHELSKKKYFEFLSDEIIDQYPHYYNSSGSISATWTVSNNWYYIPTTTPITVTRR